MFGNSWMIFNAFFSITQFQLLHVCRFSQMHSSFYALIQPLSWLKVRLWPDHSKTLFLIWSSCLLMFSCYMICQESVHGQISHFHFEFSGIINSFKPRCSKTDTNLQTRNFLCSIYTTCATQIAFQDTSMKHKKDNKYPMTLPMHIKIFSHM